MRTYFVRCNFISSPTTVSTNEKSRMFCPLDDVSLNDASFDDASLRRCVPWTMCLLDDASLENCVPWTMHPLDDVSLNDASLERCFPWTTRPLKDASSNGRVDHGTHRPRDKYRTREMKICSSPSYWIISKWTKPCLSMPLHDYPLLLVAIFYWCDSSVYLECWTNLVRWQCLISKLNCH